MQSYAERILEKNRMKETETAIVDRNGYRETSWHTLRETAHKVAVWAEEKSLSGVVPVCMERSAEAVASFLGLNLAGVGIAPLYEGIPADRKRRIAEETGNAVFTEADFERAMETDAEKAVKNRTPANPAAVIFTSGSTGTPKGVMLDNDALIHVCDCASGERLYAYRETDNALQTASFSFVSFFGDLFAPLYAGATVHILAEAARRDAAMITDYINAHQITTAFLAPKLLRLLGEIPTMRRVVSAGERMRGVEPKPYEIINAYGMSETAMAVCAYPVTASMENTPIGTPVSGFRCYLLDENGNPADEGELCVSGAIASGYYHNPTLTEAVFTKNPFSDEAGHAVLLHTGDLVRRLPDGNYLFLNRRDFMLKINGQRVEPGETEAAFREVCAVRDVVVKGFTEADGRTCLCAYYEADATLDVGEVRQKLAEKLPSYMLPSYYVRLDTIPVNANGKPDRDALPPPQIEREQCAYTAPAGEAEMLLCRAFEAVLHLDRIGADDDFFRLGGDSMRAMELARYASALFLTADDVLRGRTPRGIAGLAKEKEPEADLPSVPSHDTAPLTDSQMGVYLQWIQRPDSVMYNIPIRLTIPRAETMTAQTVKRAADAVIRCHSALYASLKAEEDGVFMCRMPFPVDGICIAEERADAWSADEENAFIQPFSLYKGPLCRACAVLTAHCVYLYLDCHHVIADGTSLALLAGQICEKLAGNDPAPETADAFAAYDIENNSVTAEVLSAAKAHFDSFLADSETDSNLLFDRKPDENTGYLTDHMEKTLTLPRLLPFLRKHGLTENSFFMGVFGYVLAKMTGQTESRFAAAENGRRDSRFDKTVSMFVRTLPVLMRPDETKTASSFLADGQAQFFASVSCDVCSFGELSREYGVTSDVMFVYQSDLFSGFESPVGVVDVKPLPLGEGFTNLALSVMKRGDSYTLSVGYRSACYTAETVRRFLAVYERTAAAFAEDAVLKDICLIGAEDFAFLQRLNATDSTYDTAETVVDRFRRMAKTYPDKTALVCRENRYTYREADEITDRLAVYIRSLGIGEEQTVSVLIPRCEYMLLASMGILKAGAVYQPLDPSYPSERLTFMCRDADSALLIADRTLLPLLPSYEKPVLCLDEIPALPMGKTDWEVPHMDNGFVLLYTSGTTGLPKGCKLTHRNIAAYVHAYHTLFDVNDRSVAAAYASYGFDAHTSELYPVLTAGGTLHIVTEEIRLDLPALKAYFEDNGVTHTVMTTQLARQFVTEYPEVRHLRHILAGGEKLASVTPPKTYRLTNGYGPTEATVMVSCFTLDGVYTDIPIGKALPNTKLYVVDAYGRRMPIGVPGELIACGPQVSCGYLNREEKTKEVFVPNTFEDVPSAGYEHCYRTGDIVRFLETGNLEIIGRRDMQVKIRGFRIELSEVEAVIREYPQVRDAVVVAAEEPSGGKCIHAYLVSDQTVDIAELNRFIRERKPPYMVPAASMQIDRIPLTPNFKVDKRKLPPITGMQTKPSAENGSRRMTALEKELSGILREIIGGDNFSVDTDFVSAGITSITSIRLAVQIYKKYGLHITSKDILDGGSILTVENRIVDFLLENKDKENEAPQARREVYPLTQTQQGIYIDSLNGGMDTYNIPLLLKLDGGMDVAALKNAVRQAVAAHPSLLCRIYADENGEAAVHPTPAMAYDIEEETVSSLSVPPTRFAFTEEAPLFRFRILHYENALYFLMELHHIIADGASVHILLEDIARAYRGIAPESEAYTAYDLSEDEQMARSGGGYSAAKAYYDSVFRGISADYLPCADRRDAACFREDACPLNMAEDAVRAFCKTVGISETVLFNGAFAVTLARFTAHEDAYFATLHNGRGDPRTERLVTMAVKTMPFYIETPADMPVVTFLRNVDERLMALKKYDVYSFADAAREYGVAPEPMFIYQGDMMREMPLGETVSPDGLFAPAKAKSALSLEVACGDGGYRLHCEYDGGRYSAAWIAGFLDAYATCVTELLHRETLGDTDICSEAAMRQFTAFNNTEWEIPYRPAYRLFEESVQRHPEKPAVIADGGQLTYRQLDGMTNVLARRLCVSEKIRDAVIEVLLDRTKEIYVAQLGILKSANAFLCLSPAYPDERIRFITEDSDAKAILTTRAIAKERETLMEQLRIPVIFVDDLDTDATAESLTADVAPDALAYVIYTSGSTGKPKGVTVTQKGLVNVTVPNPYNPETTGYVDDATVSTAVSAFTFDASVMEGFVALANGSTVCIAGENEIHNPEALCSLCKAYGVTSLFGTPSFLMNLSDYEGFAAVAAGLRTVMAGGEEFPPALLDKLAAMNPSMRIINGYGPSEATITCSCKYLKKGEPITIGTPLTNTKLYCVDARNHILPMGACGELAICGDGVGKGYLHRDDLTKKAFITLKGKPTFRTGDLAVITHDGEIEFHGRVDNQVKIRGLRVELGEIESVINSYPGVKTSVTVVKGEGENRYLAAYYTAETVIADTALIAFLSEKLAQYMVPRVWMQLETMPLTANGKTDRKALPEIKREAERKTGSAALTQTEKRICDLMSTVLGLPQVYADDNFFEIGGNSLAASRVVMQLKAKGYAVEYQTIFDCQTPHALAAYLGDAADTVTPETDTGKLGADGDPTDPAFRDVLQYNCMQYADVVKREPLGTVLLTGAVGFLGIHILWELLHSENGHILCLVRRGTFDSPQTRLNAISFYYFGECLYEKYPDRITLVDADITSGNLGAVLADSAFDTIINCAASVKHYAADNSIAFVNVHGVENLIALAKEKGARLVHISTTSVGGVHTEESYRSRIRLYENRLFMMDAMENQYVLSKYHAEQRMLEAIRDGMRGKIIRVGNLMGRYRDGEFQINMNSNAFLNALRGFAAIGKSPVSHCTDPLEFSPIDCTAQAVVVLAGTDDRYTVFHANNRSTFDEMMLIHACNRCGIPIVPTDDREYYAEYTRLLGDPAVNKYLAALLTNDRPDLHAVESDNGFTANVLYRLGFAWPFTDDAYLERVVKQLRGIGFFDR